MRDGYGPLLATFVMVVTLGAVAQVRAGQNAAGIRPPAGLTAVEASSRAVSLSWTADAGSKSFVVERKLLGAAWPATGATPAASIGTADAAAFTDGKVDQFATYVYRVRAQGAAAGSLSSPSNEVTVGPPPTGFSQVVTTPKAMQDHDASQFAGVISMALDANGDPAFAYLLSDLNNDGENPDSAIDFLSWNRAKYRWNAAVRIATVGDVARSGTRPSFSLAFDGTAGAGIAYLVQDRQLQVALSRDAGATWTSALVQQVGPEDSGLSTPSLALDAGKAYLAYFAGHGEVVFRSGSSTDNPSTWSTQKAPLLSGTFDARAEGISVAVAADHRPAMIYVLNPSEGYTVTVAFWRPGQASAVKVLDTQNHQADDPGAALAVTAGRMAVAFYGGRDEQFFNGHHVWMSRSADQGATWSAAALAADDGGHEMVPPVSIAIDRNGRYAMGAPIGGGNENGSKCGQPSLMRSADGVAWTTCAPNTRGIATAADPRYALVTFAGNDKVYEVFHAQQAGGGMVPGLVLWREP